MTGGFLYILWNPVYEKYGKNVYKLGKTVNLPKRKSGYTTPYIEQSVFKHQSAYFDDMDMAEKILFAFLHKYRIKDRREFFKCDFEIIKSHIDKVESILCKNKEITINEDTIKPTQIETVRTETTKIETTTKITEIKTTDIKTDIKNEFICPYCKYNFTKKSNLTRHLKNSKCKNYEKINKSPKPNLENQIKILQKEISEIKMNINKINPT